MEVALSVKQPWATLLVHGLKTIEVRTWPTSRSGRVLIHAASVPDPKEEGWAQVPADLREAAQMSGGIIGAGELVGCIVYRSREAFAADKARHLNHTDWFHAPALYGFQFRDLVTTSFRPYPGWVRFFEVKSEALPAQEGETVSQLLVSVRSPEEAQAAVAGGAALIDVKEPNHGPLGRADDATVARVLSAVGGRQPVSAAFGELRDNGEPLRLSGLAFAKWGLAGLGNNSRWSQLLGAAIARLREVIPGCRAVAVAYADWQRADAPDPESIAAFAADHGCGAFLLDTFHKDGRTLLDWLSRPVLERICRAAQLAGVPVALAGSLGIREIQALLDLAPDWFAVRGAACSGGRRERTIDVRRVRQLRRTLQPFMRARCES